jgi:hypothetical protein
MVRARLPSPTVLHRRVEALLDRGREAVDLVDEQHVAGLERGEVAGEHALVLDRGARRDVDADPELVREDLRHRGLAEPRRTVEQRVVERLAALLGGRHEHLELALERVLPDVLGEPLRPQARGSVGVVVGRVAVDQRAVARCAVARCAVARYGGSVPAVARLRLLDRRRLARRLRPRAGSRRGLGAPAALRGFVVAYAGQGAQSTPTRWWRAACC